MWVICHRRGPPDTVEQPHSPSTPRLHGSLSGVSPACPPSSPGQPGPSVSAHRCGRCHYLFNCHACMSSCGTSEFRFIESAGCCPSLYNFTAGRTYQRSATSAASIALPLWQCTMIRLHGLSACLQHLAQVFLHIQKDLPILQDDVVPISQSIGMLCEGA